MANWALSPTRTFAWHQSGRGTGHVKVVVCEADYRALKRGIEHLPPPHAHRKFLVSPRLLLTSPEPSCGKTTVLDLVESLAWHGLRASSYTAAALYRLGNQGGVTLLLDEADNAQLTRPGPLQALINSGHRRGDRFLRAVGRVGWQGFQTYIPVGLAAISGLTALPPQTLSRCIVIPMHKAADRTRLKSIDPEQPDPDIDAAYRLAFAWGRTARLNPKPEMPSGLRRGRLADNWRPLISIADYFGDKWGKAAREAALSFRRRDGFAGGSVGTLLLITIRAIFDDPPIDRIAGVDLIARLIDIEDGPWGEYRGLRGNLNPRPITQDQLAAVLGLYEIRPKSVWPRRRPKGAKSRKGYTRDQFEFAWSTYCNPEDDESQPNSTKGLHG